MERKDIITHGLLALALLLAASCREPRLGRAVEEAGRDFPMPIEGIGELTGIECIGGNVVVTVTVDSGKGARVVGNLMGADQDAVRRGFKVILAEAPIDRVGLLDAMKEAGACLEIRYGARGPGKPYTVSLGPGDIRDMDGRDLGPGDFAGFLETMAAVESADCPMEVEDGVRLVRVTAGNGFVTYEFLMDEGLYSIGNMNKGIPAMREGIMAGLAARDAATRREYLRYVRAGMGLAYRYTGDRTGETCTVEIGPKDIAGILGDGAP